VTTLAYPNGQSVTKTYDSLVRLSSVTDWLANTTDFSYDADSDLTGAITPTASIPAQPTTTPTRSRRSPTPRARRRWPRSPTPATTTATSLPRPIPGRRERGPRLCLQPAARADRGLVRRGYGYDAAHDLTTNPAGPPRPSTRRASCAGRARARGRAGRLPVVRPRTRTQVTATARRRHRRRGRPPRSPGTRPTTWPR